MKEYLIIKQVFLSSAHTRTGKTRHYLGEDELPASKMLKIVKYEDENGFYLIHFDADGKEMTDTFHDTLDDAMEQAEWEYQVKPDEWEVIN